MPNLIPCFVINLEKDTQRRSAMQTRLAKLGITPEFFKAVDGRLMSPEALEGHVNRIEAQQEYGALSAAEIGTALSHIGIYQEMVQKHIPYAVILEDDVCLDEKFATYLNTHGPSGLAAAEKLAQHLHPVWTVADHWNRFEEKGLVSLWALQRNIVWEAREAQESNLSPTRKPRVKPPKTLKTRLSRLFYELVTKPFFTQRLKRHP
jgi:glycosyl transferase family 25